MIRRMFGLTTTALVLAATDAQAQANASVQLTASVIGRLSVTTSGSTNFGTFDNAAHTETLLSSAPGAGRSVARFAVEADANRLLIFTCSSNLLLTAPGTASTLTFNGLFGVDTGAGYVETTAQCPRVELSTGSGSFAVGLGGRIVVPNNQPAGSYSGTFTLTVNY